MCYSINWYNISQIGTKSKTKVQKKIYSGHCFHGQNKINRCTDIVISTNVILTALLCCDNIITVYVICQQFVAFYGLLGEFGRV